MSAPDDHSVHLPEDGSHEFQVLHQSILSAAKRGDTQALQDLGARGLAHMNPRVVRVALQHRQGRVVEWLVQESERTGIDLAGGWKSLHVASLLGRLDELRAATDEELMQTTRSRNTVLHAAAAGDQAGVIEYLVHERALDVHAVDAVRCNALEMASECGCVSAIEALVACGASVDDEGGEPCTALLLAAEYGQVAAMEKLVQLGVDVATVGSMGGAVHAAVRSGQVEAVDAAVRLGASPCALVTFGGTPLHTAALYDEPAMVRGLVRLGACVDAVDNDGNTSLHVCVACAAPQACRTLLELGADRWVKDDKGHTARSFAASIPWNRRKAQAVIDMLGTYWPIVPSMTQLWG